MIIIILTVSLLATFLLHILFIILYFQTRKKTYINLFLNTAVFNIIIAAAMIFIALKKPEWIRNIDFRVLTWLISGLFMLIFIGVQISIFRKIYKRSKMPEHYHLNFFGKKVLHGSVISPVEVMTFFITIPFLLITGSYFVARLINYILYKHL